MEKTNEKRNRMKRIMLMLCAAVVAISTVLGSGVTEVQAKQSKVDKVVKHARAVYYGTNEKLKEYKISGMKGINTDYCDKNGILRKTVMSAKEDAPDSVKGYTCEYYYDSKQNTCFIFAYKKVKGKVKEYRAYYGADGKLYRYIGPSGKIKDYKKGKDLTDSSKLVSKLYYASLMHLHYVL